MTCMTPEHPLEFQPLPGLYEPSAIAQLPDGRFLVVEDEKDYSFSLLTLGADGRATSQPLGPGWFQSGQPIWKLEDLEGLTQDSEGYFYAITSHSRTDSGDEKKPRDKLARFRIDGNRLTQPVVVGGLKPALLAAHPVLAAAARVLDAKSGAGLNIEALAITPDGQRLLVGFRSPLQAGLALIASIDNPAAIFDSGAAAQVAGALLMLDLGGQGIRSLSYVAALAGYLVVSGPANREDVEFGLWFWTGLPGAPARRVTVPGLDNLAHAEGVCPAVLEGIAGIVIISDDGNRDENRSAHFLRLTLDQLHIAL